MTDQDIFHKDTEYIAHTYIACIKACPTRARSYHSELYEQIQADFEKLCAEYRTPEIFYAEEDVL